MSRPVSLDLAEAVLAVLEASDASDEQCFAALSIAMTLFGLRSRSSSRSAAAPGDLTHSQSVGGADRCS
jgi:hypothetical protein